jgi:hypothetical protein
MATFAKGSFSVDLGLIRLGGELSNLDRQCAWELYTELETRVSVTGKRGDATCTDFNGELYVESLDSLYRFFQEARSIMRKFPVGRIGLDVESHLGIVIGRVLFGVLRPFLEKWHVRYRHWWLQGKDDNASPLERQQQFPDLKEMLEAWTNVRLVMRETSRILSETYRLTKLG